MSLRTFPFRRSERGGAIAAVTSLVCGKCGTEEEMVQPNGRFAKPEAVIRWFNGRGWSVGGRIKADRCPHCAGRLKQKDDEVTKHVVPKRPFVSEPSEAARVTRAEIIALSEGPAVTRSSATETVLPGYVQKIHEAAKLMTEKSPALVTEIPAAPTPSDRRIIFAKLEEVYLDEVKGYSANWTDDRVSKDLGVPRAWVAEVREINFGPLRDNEQMRELLQKIDAMSKETASVIKACDESKRALDIAQASFIANHQWLIDVRERMRALERAAKNLSA